MKRGLWKKNRRGESENLILPKIIFITLNIMFAIVILAFVFRTSSGAVIYEQMYSKQIALLIQESEPLMVIKLNMEKAMELAEKKGVAFEDVVSIDNNMVTVKFSEKGGYGYSFFNDVEVHAYPYEEDNEYTGEYILTINEKKEDENA